MPTLKDLVSLSIRSVRSKHTVDEEAGICSCLAAGFSAVYLNQCQVLLKRILDFPVLPVLLCFL